MTHPPGWTEDEPCPSCGSQDITEYEIRIGASQIRMGWECCDCGHLATWEIRPGGHASRAGERVLLPVMPLHAITTVYGEQGLRERLALEAAQLADPQQARRALELASRLHAQDRRQREPYVNHLLRVALRIMIHYEVRDTEVICAALMHDAVEDHADDLSADGRPGALATLAATFGARTAALIEAVTNPQRQPGTHADTAYREHVADSLARSPWARAIKVSDFTDNGIGLIHTTGPRVEKLARKYAPLVPIFADLIARPDTPLPNHVKARILSQLDRANERFAAITTTSEGR